MSHLRSITAITSVFVLLFSAIFLSSCTTPEGNVADGERWYRMHNCYSCHGDNGNDGRGPKIANMDMGYRSFVSRLRNAESQIMPEYSKEKISDQDAADIFAFLQSGK